MFDAEDWIPAVTSGWKIGPATVSYTVKPNMDLNQARSGRLQLYGTQSAALVTHVVTQAGPSCLYFVSPAQTNLSAAGGDGSFAVTTTPSDCSWTAAPDAAWVSILSGASGTGARTVTYRALPNTGASRTTGIVVSGLTIGLNPTSRFTIVQSGPALSGR